MAQETDETTEGLPRELRRTSFVNKARFQLQRQLFTRGRLKTLLRNRAATRKAVEAAGIDPERVDAEIDVALDRLEREGLIDDEAFARGLVDSLRRKGRSRVRIEQELHRKEVPEEYARAALAGLDANEATPRDGERTACARHVRRRRLGPWRIRTTVANADGPPDNDFDSAADIDDGGDDGDDDGGGESRRRYRRERMRDLASCVRAGFSAETARDVLALSREEIEELADERHDG